MHRPLRTWLARALAALLLPVVAAGAFDITLPAPVDGVLTKHVKGTIANITNGFVEYIPVGYASQTDRKFPLLIVFGGTGEIGDGSAGASGLGKMANINPIKKAAEHNTAVWNFDDHAGDRSAVILGLQVSNTKPFRDDVLEFDKITRAVMRSRRIDPDRVYITGLSLGGGNTSMYAQFVNNRFAAIVPICGSDEGKSTYRYQNLAPIAIWAFHGFGDGTVPRTVTRDVMDNTVRIIDPAAASCMADPIFVNGSTNPGLDYTGTWNPVDGWDWHRVSTGEGFFAAGVGVPATRAADRKRFTMYTTNAHDTWTRTYNNPDVYAWLFAQRRAPGAEGMDVVVDNAQWWQVSQTGVSPWADSRNTMGFHDINYAVNNPKEGVRTFNFLPTLPSAGTYEVYMRWIADSARDPTVRVDVTHASGTATVIVNQQVDGAQWNLIGTYGFAVGASATVAIITEGLASEGFIVADAVAFKRLSGGNASPAISQPAAAVPEGLSLTP